MPFFPNPFLPPGLPTAFGLPLARKRVALPESISALDGRAFFKVRGTWGLLSKCVPNRDMFPLGFPKGKNHCFPLYNYYGCQGCFCQTQAKIVLFRQKFLLPSLFLAAKRKGGGRFMKIGCLLKVNSYKTLTKILQNAVTRRKFR